jgi:hypothetical protein
MPKVTYTVGKGLVQESGGGITMNYLDFLSGNLNNLTDTVAAVTDAEADSAKASATATTIAAARVAPNAVNTLAWDSGAAGSIYLPRGTVDTHLVVHLTGDPDEANALDIFCQGAADASGSEVLAKQVISSNVGSAAAASVLTAGTSTVPTSVKLIYTPAATATNFLQAGSLIHFYCIVENQWLVRIQNVTEGVGSTGALTVA